MQIDSRTVLTFATGARSYITMAKGLAISLDMHGSTAPRTIFTDHPDDPETRQLYATVLAPPPEYPHWFMKLAALDATKADQILYIDGDCLAVQNVDALFDSLRGSDFAVQGMWREDPGDWYGPMRAIMDREGIAAVPQFSGGFLYYERTERAQELIQEVMALASRYDELGLRRNGGHVVDEVCIALAMAKTGIGKVFPDSLNASMTPWRAIGPVHLDVLRGECSFARKKPELEVVRPMIYHSARAKWDTAYWRELRKVLRAYRLAMPPRMRQTQSARLSQKAARLITDAYRWLFRKDLS